MSWFIKIYKAQLIKKVLKIFNSFYYWIFYIGLFWERKMIFMIYKTLYISYQENLNIKERESKKYIFIICLMV